MPAKAKEAAKRFYIPQRVREVVNAHGGGVRPHAGRSRRRRGRPPDPRARPHRPAAGTDVARDDRAGAGGVARSRADRMPNLAHSAFDAAGRRRTLVQQGVAALVRAPCAEPRRTDIRDSELAGHPSPGWSETAGQTRDLNGGRNGATVRGVVSPSPAVLAFSGNDRPGASIAALARFIQRRPDNEVADMAAG